MMEKPRYSIGDQLPQGRVVGFEHGGNLRFGPNDWIYYLAVDGREDAFCVAERDISGDDVKT
jgi:hypothetical protein